VAESISVGFCWFKAKTLLIPNQKDACHMRYTRIAFLLTLGVWAALTTVYIIIELIRGNPPFNIVRWEVNGKLLLLVFLSVTAIGTSVGYVSDQMRRPKNR